MRAAWSHPSKCGLSWWSVDPPVPRRGEDSPRSVTVEREGAKITLRLHTTEKSETVHRVVSLAQLTSAQQLVRDGWLKRQITKSLTP